MLSVGLSSGEKYPKALLFCYQFRNPPASGLPKEEQESLLRVSCYPIGAVHRLVVAFASEASSEESFLLGNDCGDTAPNPTDPLGTVTLRMRLMLGRH